MKTNPLPTPLDAVQWAITFAQMDLDAATAKELQQQRHHLDAFLNPRRPTIWARVPMLDRAALLGLQTVVVALLTAIAQAGHAEVDLRLRFWAVRQRKPDSKPDSRRRGDPRAYLPEVDVLVSGEPRDWIRYRLIRLLEALGANRLQVCPDPDCGRLFFKVTRKTYCSSTCQSRIYMRHYRY